MADANYVVQYSDTTGFVLGMWFRASSDNMATYVADGFLEVDGVQVIAGIDTGYRSDLQVAMITNPTDVESEIYPNVLEVDNPATPTDVVFRSDGDRNPEYDFPAAP